MTARIDHEHAGREALESQRQGLLKKKLGLVAENKKRKDDLAALDKDLETFIDVSWRAWGVWGLRWDWIGICANSGQAAKPIISTFEKVI